MDTKISDTKMQETIVETKVITHDLKDILARRAVVQKEVDELTVVLNDFDLLIARLEKAGCKTEEIK